ncbi:hypothetical protein RM697_08105 [Ichthyenterobacterium sp. W332]|uniref:DUF3592 domain-containing protein n=1 Tax=Microcosmobacter mediterraneus TaxID=3075607 RepID=A0ABU2YKA6_9FLAO|nr:hypothetical protein [Ichthyenterobacterium sp. W332]MDT0558605.1 hypothetical protein [Ichthyenterobacterium sp. W332]
MKNSSDRIIGLPFLYMVLLSTLDYFFKDYIGSSEFEISVKVYVLIFIITLVSVFVFVLKNSQEKDKFIRIMKSFSYGTFCGFMLLMFIALVKDQSAFYLNKSYSKEKIQDKFVVTYRNNSEGENGVGLGSYNYKVWFSTKNKFSSEDLLFIQKNDTIKIEFYIGLLNKPFLPFGKIEIIE